MGAKFRFNEGRADVLVMSFVRAALCAIPVAFTGSPSPRLFEAKSYCVPTLLLMLLYACVKALAAGSVDAIIAVALAFGCAEPLAVASLRRFQIAQNTRSRRASSADYESLSLADVAADEGRFGNTHMRFTVLYAGAILAVATLPAWLSAAAPRRSAYVVAIMMGIFSAMWLWIAFNAICNYRRLLWRPVTSLTALKAARRRQFKHIVIVPCYLDPIDVLFACIGSLVLQGPQAASRLVVVVTFEARTPDVDAKARAVREAFQHRFGDLLIVRHTLIPSREIPGGCSNKNFALRTAHAYVRKKYESDGNGVVVNGGPAVQINGDSRHETASRFAWTVTTCDTDSLFHPEYFSTLECVYNEKNPRLGARPAMCVWQPPLFYTWDLDERPFFNRITGVMRSMMMMGGLISFNLNPMSIFTYPLELGATAGYINPRYSVDDIIAKVRWMCDTDEKVPVELLPVPVISGPTIGTSWMQEWDEWARQIRRWIVGSSESFHYFAIHFRGRPLISGVVWIAMFFLYYGVLLCSAGVFGLLAGLPFPWAQPPADVDGTLFGHRVTFSYKWVGLYALAVQYVAFAVGFALDRFAVRMMRVKEDLHPLRNLTHWLLAPPVLLLYSLVAFGAILRFVWAGKRMAGHDMAAKEGLKAGDNELADAVRAALETQQPDRKTIQVRSDGKEQLNGTTGLLYTIPERVHFGGYKERVEDLSARTCSCASVLKVDNGPTLNGHSFPESKSSGSD